MKFGLTIHLSDEAVAEHGIDKELAPLLRHIASRVEAGFLPATPNAGTVRDVNGNATVGEWFIADDSDEVTP